MKSCIYIKSQIYWLFTHYLLYYCIRLCLIKFIVYFNGHLCSQYQKRIKEKKNVFDSVHSLINIDNEMRFLYKSWILHLEKIVKNVLSTFEGGAETSKCLKENRMTCFICLSNKFLCKIQTYFNCMTKFHVLNNVLLENASLVFFVSSCWMWKSKWPFVIVFVGETNVKNWWKQFACAFMIVDIIVVV